MDLYQITNKQKTRKWLQASVQKLLGQPHSNIALESGIYNSSVNFILKGFPVTHLPPVSAKFQAMISSVTSGWVFMCQAWSFIAIPSLAFLYNLHNHFIRILTHMDLPVPQPFAGSNACTVAISILSPSSSLFRTIFSSCFTHQFQI